MLTELQIQEVGCHVCNFWQDIKFRPDVESGHGAAPAVGGPPPVQYQMSPVKPDGAGPPGGQQTYQ
jgi:hypothetical protein